MSSAPHAKDSKPRILVTGAAGFIGARFVETCTERDIPTIAVDLLTHFKNRTEHHIFEFDNVVDRDGLSDWLELRQPHLQAIVHLGACTDTTQMDVAYLNRMNLEYSKMLWNYASRHKIPFIYASSAATYGEGELGYNDDESLITRLKPLNPYGESKRLFDLWALDEEKKGNHPPSWAGFKFFNVYGYGERHKKKMASVVLHAFDQISQSGSVQLFQSHKDGIADGEQKRDFIFVQDLVKVIHFALSKPIPRGIFNLGTGQARTFLDLVNATFIAMGRIPAISFIPTPEHLKERYQYFTQAQMDRLRAEGYARPFTSIEEGVADYVARLQKNQALAAKGDLRAEE
ncbi:MAG: ADP-glyceromanno-heptose 6-epimerase [Methylotenera sp.]|nr:ADP-glyceromanno-heptose 6-epimerase [Oligoflexia bacterium]